MRVAFRTPPLANPARIPDNARVARYHVSSFGEFARPMPTELRRRIVRPVG
jgi:hypothetical protein